MARLSKYVLVVLLFSLIVLLFPISNGCSGANSTSTAPNTFIKLLGMVPPEAAQPNHPILVTLINYASLYKDEGITFTSLDEFLDKAGKNEIIARLTGMGSETTGYGNYTDKSTIQEKYVGYNFTNIDAEIQFGAPPSNGMAAIGRFNPQKTRDALQNQAEWPSEAISLYEIEEYDSVTIHSWGDGKQTNLAIRRGPPHIDNVGRMRPLAVTDDRLFSTFSVYTTKLAIDASNNKVNSLADLQEYTAIANAMADLNAYGAMIGDGRWLLYDPDSHVYSPSVDRAKVTEMLKNNPDQLLERYLTFGTGVGKDEKGIYMAVVIYNKDNQTASENANRLERQVETGISWIKGVNWTEMFTDTDIQAKGNLVIARLYTKGTMLWGEIVYSRDSLLLQAE
jgi:hypothetical protein